MGGIITEAARQDAWRLAVSSAREGNLVAFADKGVAVLNRELAGRSRKLASVGRDHIQGNLRENSEIPRSWDRRPGLLNVERRVAEVTLSKN